MLQDTATIRCYQKLTDAFTEMWNRGYRFDEIRLYLDGYVTALRHNSILDSYKINRLEEEATRFLYDRSNFEMSAFQPETERY